MSKELTEKFMNDELDDRLYYFTQKMSQDTVEIGHSFAFNMVRADDGEYLDWFLIHEVLAPVPSYDEFIVLSDFKKIEKDAIDNLVKIHTEKLEKKLEIAKKALKDCYNDMNYWAVLTRRNQRILSVIKKALKEMEGVK